MIAYHRNIQFKLLVRRIAFVLLAGLIVHLFNGNLTDYAITLSLVVLTLSFFPVTSLTVNADHIDIKKYYLFGFLPLTRTLHTKDILGISSFELQLESDTDAHYPASGCLISIALIFLPKPTLKIAMFTIQYLNKNGAIRKTREKLTVSEYHLIQDIITQQTAHSSIEQKPDSTLKQPTDAPDYDNNNDD
ncbi:MAG: hypothetical protein JWQ27_376 [Ferruginibacter sp.]|nr:hypothetical protein [Ferruginibacter sp.]